MSGPLTIPVPGGVPIHAWVDGVPFDGAAQHQLAQVAKLPFVVGHVAVMPDVHVGVGATVGSVIPTAGAIVPAAVGVDIGCGMMAVRTSLTASDLPDHLDGVRLAIEAHVPVGFAAHPEPTAAGRAAWKRLRPGFQRIVDRHPKVGEAKELVQLGTLGGGNHFVEVCLDESDRVWVMLHSGSRGVGNRIGQYFIELAREDLRGAIANLPDRDLAYFTEGTQHFDDYVEAVGWAQDYARTNREAMMTAVLGALEAVLPPFTHGEVAVNCHHNYVARETHFGREVLVTRKGAVRAGLGELGIIPGSMGTRSYIVCGKGHPQSLCSCSHGAGRAMSRGEAKRRFTLDDHARATAHVACRKDEGVLDETPGAYKSIDAVMAAQADLVDVVHELRQVVCVKG
jgi:tRNA-splicing ligase RtcB